MDSSLKQRLVGALILLALAVVFWPIIFVPPAEQGDDVRVIAPAAPPVDTSPLPEPDDLGLGPEQLAAAAGAGPDVLLPAADPAAPPPGLAPRGEVLPDPELEAAAEQLQAPRIDEEGLPLAWSLQVATVSEEARSRALREELLAADYKAYIKRLRRGEQLLYRVLVGPRFTRDELLPVKAAVDERWGVDSLIMRYLP